jgi:DNA-directed RNA polymerase subunit RPC12/RpoP
MPVKVRCSSCDKVLTVPDAARGKAVKCPQCETKIPVPAGDSDAPKPKKKPVAAKTAKSSKPVDSEDALASLDLRRAEDTNARICSKCGYDMQEMDEEETECPKCGFDIEAGGLGVKARKRAMKGPDPADFYPGLAKNAFNFMLKNQSLCWRTAGYTTVCLLISMFCGFMYLWLSAWPPRAFFLLCLFVSFMVIPGWLWLLDTEVIKLTLEKKDKFKKLNFDFFLASSKGVMSIGWLVVGAGPILIIPIGIGYYLVNYSGQPPWVMGICVGVGLIPVLWMLPVTMSHMTMPISGPGWMFWKVGQYWARCVPACSVWLMWLILTCLPLIGSAATIGAVWGADIETIVNTMESNADINRRLLAAANAPKGKNAQPIDPATIGAPADVSLIPMIGPSIILLLSSIPLGFIAMFNMRTNGLFTYYFRERMELIDKAKEYKYVAKERRGEDEDDEERSLQQDAVEGITISLVCIFLGLIGGMIYGAVTDAGIYKGIMIGTFIGIELAALIAQIALIIAGFTESPVWGLIVWFVPFGFIVFIANHWIQTRKLLFQWLTPIVALVILAIVFFATGGPEMFPPPQPPA